MRPHHTWAAFAGGVALVLAGMGWVSAMALRLDRLQRESARNAAFEENVRLALWRMDTALVPLLAREGARPYFVYASFYPAERAYTRMFEALADQDVMVPSPLLSERPADVMLHFQVDPGGRVSSPQAPVGRSRDLSVSIYGNGAAIDEAGRRLRELEAYLKPAALLAALPAGESSGGLAGAPRAAGMEPGAGAQGQEPVQQEDAVEGLQQVLLAGIDAQQSLRNVNEYNVRVQQQAKVQVRSGKGMASAAQGELPQAAAKVAVSTGVAPGPEGGVREGAMRPVWAEGHLLLARRVAAAGGTYIQGGWLDWPAIRGELLDEIRDLLPGAELRPAEGGPDGSEGRFLAGLPVRLAPGSAPAMRAAGISPVQVSLLIAWACLLGGAGAVAILLAGVVSLSERRAAFVSAVTHELRTPLTTFRMYAEMLAEGMVRDEAKRRQYLETLSAESGRLAHLVENVLSYARLERGRRGGRLETEGLADLLGRMAERLAQRAGQAEMLLEVGSVPEWVAVRTDGPVLEQILFNLVDNACKYAARAEDRRIHIEATVSGGRVEIRVRDHGPGLDPADMRRLFRPFSKSAKRAAETAPGVGLGLALSRRLARQMGGDLRYDGSVRGGACFEVVLPKAG